MPVGFASRLQGPAAGWDLDVVRAKCRVFSFPQEGIARLCGRRGLSREAHAWLLQRLLKELRRLPTPVPVVIGPSTEFVACRKRGLFVVSTVKGAEELEPLLSERKTDKGMDSVMGRQRKSRVQYTHRGIFGAVRGGALIERKTRSFKAYPCGVLPRSRAMAVTPYS